MNKYKEVLCNKGLLEKRERHFSRLENLFSGQRSECAFALNGVNGYSETDAYKEPEKWVEKALENLAGQAELLSNEEVFRPLVLENWLYGVHFTDRVFGADVYFSNVNGYWWSRGLQNKIGELPVPDLERNEIWNMAKQLTLAMVNCGATVPLICTQVLGAPLNQTFNLYKERLLMEFYDDVDGVKRDLEVMTETLCEMHKWFRNVIPEDQMQPIGACGRCQPRGFGQMCGCSTHLVSPDIYNEFVAQLDERVFSIYPNGGMFHLCGRHTQHLKTWREMKQLRAVQVNDRAAEDLEIYYRELRDDQIIYLNPTETMTIERAMEITGGRRLVIVADIKTAPIMT